MKDSDGSAIDVRTHTLQTLWCRAGLALAYPPGIPTDAVITSLTDDSRRVAPGCLFVAVRGTNCDGHRYIEQAVLAGAAAVVVDQDTKTFGDATYLRVQDSRAALGRLAAAFYGLYERPADKLKLIGVTGTNGKTTVAWMLRSILQAAGEKAALLGTIEYDLIGDRVAASLTTPGPVDLCRHLSAAAAAGARYAVIEVSSHALDQRRTEGLRWAVGVFTNLSGDHLDYHGSMDAYAAAKRRLFEQLDSHATAVVNGDDPATASVTATTRASVSRFGLNGGVCEVGATIESMTASGSQFVIRFEDGAVPVRIGLVGRHNISNALAAAAAGRALGLSPEAVRLGLDSLRGVPGRLQRIAPEESPFSVVVDYAHTDDALRNVLKAIRPLTAGRLRCVFGCGGDRDRGKRPRMAAVVQELADVAYVTSDNPRTEDPQAIVDEILRGFRPQAAKSVRVDVDRRRAIARAIAEADPGDTVLIAGKGHEDYQIVGDEVLPFDDAIVARECLETAVTAGGVA